MRTRITLAAILLTLATVAATPAATKQVRHLKQKQAAVESIERHRDELIDLSDRIWKYAELALRENRSAAALADYAEAQGFTVQRGVSGMPTAFVASYGEGRPIIGILGEYDALPGLSQKASPVKEALEAGAAGHGCGHNMFGPASLGAALAIREMMGRGELRGTIRFYGTPAEESIGGKTYMARDGMFDDLDVALAWHPDSETRADTESSQAMVDLTVEFHGKAAHAAYDPWNGRSAVDGAELFTHGLNMLREHVHPSVRIHYAITDGGKVPNVIPEYARVWTWVRDSKRTGVEDVLARVRDIARGAAVMAGVESTVTVGGGSYEMLVNMSGAHLLQDNLEWLGPIRYSEEEQAFARALQTASGVDPSGMDGSIQPFAEPPADPPGGSTDVADVSWVVPTLHLTVATAPKKTAWHAWPVVAAGGMSIGHKGMLHASKALAATMIDLYSDKAVRDAVTTEFRGKTRGQTYKSYVPDGPPPVQAR